MLSSRSISATPAGAARYYAQGDYYTKGAEETSVWMGKGAAHLKLGGEATGVGEKELAGILKGNLPGGETAAWKQSETQERPHRPGRDFTFSAPKSASVAALVGGDKRLVAAHEKAVSAASDYLETYAMTRVRLRSGGLDYRLTGNIVAAAFLEFSSREEEAQLHTHLVVANMTFDKSCGKWRSMDYDGLETAKMAAGQVYRSALAKEALRLGYEIDADPTTGFFALKGVPERLIDEHSTRSKQIEAYLEKNPDDPFAAKNAKVKTRKDKATTTLSALIAGWKEKAGELLPLLEATIAAAKVREDERNRSSGLKPAKRDAVARSLRFGVGHATAGEAVVDEAAIIRHSLQVSVGETDLGDIKKALSAGATRGAILETAHQTGGRRLYRGRTMSRDLRAEERFATILKRGRGKLRAILKANTADRRLGTFRIEERCAEGVRTYPLSTEQHAAAREILTSKDRVHHVQGVGGAGKSAMVGAIKSAAPLRVHLAVAKTAIAAESLGRDAGISSMTVDKFLAGGGRGIAPGGILYVDEASMLGTRAAQRIDRLASENHFRVVVIGDAKQLPAIEQGKPHALAAALGAGVSTLTTSRRHKTQSVQSAVAAAREGRVRAAIEAVDRVHARAQQELPGAVAHAWAASENRERNKILALDNQARVAASAEVRRILKTEGALDRNGSEWEIFTAHPMTRAQMKLPAFYPSRNAAVVFHKGDKTRRLERGAAYRIVTRNREGLILEREGARGQVERMTWNPARASVDGVAVYDIQQRELVKGDIIQWKRNAPERSGLKNGIEGVVKRVDGRKATIRFNDGKTRAIDLAKDPFWDHGYALTVYKAQGATYNHVFLLAPARPGPLLNQQTLYTALSRARYAIELWTNDKNGLVKHLERQPGGKTSALEGVGRVGDAMGERENSGDAAPLPPSLPQSSTSPEKLRTASPQDERARDVKGGEQRDARSVEENVKLLLSMFSRNKEENRGVTRDGAVRRSEEEWERSEAGRGASAPASDDRAGQSPDKDMKDGPENEIDASR